MLTLGNSQSDREPSGQAKSITPHVTTGACPACHGGNIRTVFAMNNLPLEIGVVYDSRTAALEAPKGNFELAHCGTCGFVFNKAHDRSKSAFRPGYNVALYHSQTFRDFIVGVADRLVDRFSLHGKTVVEIGCGDGYFLNALAERGDNRGIGVDPSLPPGEQISGSDGRLRLIGDFFSSAYADLPADFVCSLSVVEVVPDVAQFLQALHSLTENSGAPLYLETFNAWRAFEENEVWSINCEMCSYFGLESLKSVFAHHGFELCDAGYCYGEGQYVYVEAKAGEAPVNGAAAHEAAIPEVLTSFGHTFDERNRIWRERFQDYRQSNRRVVAWGAGGKGITFLNGVRGSDAVGHVVEINPSKHGKFVPGSAHEIVSPEFLAEFQPETIIITNPLYEAEIRAQVTGMGLEPEFRIA